MNRQLFHDFIHEGHLLLMVSRRLLVLITLQYAMDTILAQYVKIHWVTKHAKPP